MDHGWLGIRGNLQQARGRDSHLFNYLFQRHTHKKSTKTHTHSRDSNKPGSRQAGKASRKGGREGGGGRAREKISTSEKSHWMSPHRKHKETRTQRERERERERKATRKKVTHTEVQ